MRRRGIIRAWAMISILATPGATPAADVPGPAVGTLPADARGNPLNFDFETGTLKDWSAEGDAFAAMPVEGDTVAARRSDMKSRHAGRFWVGSYERKGDDARGSLTSVPFVATKPYAGFLIGGGSFPTTCVEIVRHDTGRVVSRTSGDGTEDMKRVVVDLTPHLGKELVVRVVDRQGGGWGHVNFDDFRLLDARPAVPARTGPLALDVFSHAGLPPGEAAAAMTVPPGFKVTLFAGEPDVHQPIAFTIDDRGRLWVAEAYSYPFRLAADQARDRIVIFEDKDGDGHFDSRKVFTEGLNLVSGLEVGFGGVWVGAAPELLFIPDEDGDDRPDGPPRTLLDGWGYQDTHETLNTFTWGPDGWLYGCHGVFTHSRVGTPGTPDAARTPINAGIWRYHPTRHAFEVFAHGTSNPWGIDFDARGDAFLTSCVIPHLYYVIPGARYERQAGPHFSPYTYDDIKTIADHRHWLGATPHAGNGRSDASGGGHAHAGAMIYQGDAWPAMYRGSIFMNNIHGARINRDVLTPRGSGFVGSHAPDFLMANDSWSQILNLKYGPDGNVFMIDWYDREQCHVRDLNRHDRSNGRIFKITYGTPAPVTVDLRAMSDAELVKLQSHPNEWYVRTARRVLQERGPKPVVHAALAELAFQGGTEPQRLRGLWALYVTGGLTNEQVLGHLKQGSPHEVAWKVRLATDEGAPSPAMLDALANLAREPGSPVVRLALASALRRVPLPLRWPILDGLCAHAEDATDANIPYLVWYAAEPLAEQNPSEALRHALAAKIPLVRDFMIRRVGAIGTPEAIAMLVEAAGRAEEASIGLALARGLNESLKGRRQVAMPGAWPAVYARLTRFADPELRSQATTLALTFGGAEARATIRRIALDPTGDATLRARALADLLKIKDPGLPATLRTLLADPSLRGQALRGLAEYEDPETHRAVIELYPKLPPVERRDALNTLAARPSFAKALLTAVGDGRIAAADLSADVVRQLRNLNDPSINDQIGKVWGSARPTSADRAKRIAEMKTRLGRKPPTEPDLPLGRAVFAKACAQCHVLFGVGGKVGPELTGSNRRDLDYLLSNILDPSALIGKDYLAHVVATSDGRVLTGIIRGEDKDAVILATANETLTIPKPEIEARRPSDASMMPEDLLTPLSDHETRSLLAYLASPAQTPSLATSDNAQAFFNGRDLAGWEGDPALWSVEGGEIVGRTKGLARNEFLRSSLLAADFRLTLEVKLVANEGNSGVQFRSESLPGGEVKGYQADVGPGWWGKLYEEHGRGLLWDRSGEAHVKPGEWNRYEIVAVGPRITTAINGQPCVTLDDPAGARRGIFAFQLHSGGPTEVRFRNLRLDVSTKTATPR